MGVVEAICAVGIVLAVAYVLIFDDYDGERDE